MKIKEYGEVGLSVDFGGERYTADSYDALVLIYRDKQGKISAIEIEFEDGPDGPGP